jgi:hypothetical protein
MITGSQRPDAMATATPGLQAYTVRSVEKEHSGDSPDLKFIVYANFPIKSIISIFIVFIIYKKFKMLTAGDITATGPGTVPGPGAWSG